LSERSRLVEEDGVDQAHAFQRHPILHEDSRACRALGRDRHRERDRQPEGMGAGDHEHGDRADDGRVRHPDGGPDDRRHHPGEQGEPEEPSRGAVGQALGAGRGALRLGDQAADPGERRVVADCRDAGADPGVGRDRPGDDGIADAAFDRTRLSGDHRLVHSGSPLLDDGVRGDAPAGADQHEVSETEVGGRDQLDVVSGHALRLVGDEGRERVQRGGGLCQRAHLDPVAEKHDHDEKRELPPEVELVVQKPQRRSPGREEGHRDRKGDERHHSRAPGPQLAHGSEEERASAPEEDHGAEDGRHPADAGEVGERVAEEHREHGRERDDREGEKEHDPEQAPELSDVITVITVAAMTPVPAVAVCRDLLVLRVGRMVGVRHGLVLGFVRPRRQGILAVFAGSSCAVLVHDDHNDIPRAGIPRGGGPRGYRGGREEGRSTERAWWSSRRASARGRREGCAENGAGSCASAGSGATWTA